MEMASHYEGVHGEKKRSPQHDEFDTRTKKSKRMDMLIQMSRDFAGVHEIHETSSTIGATMSGSEPSGGNHERSESMNTRPNISDTPRARVSRDYERKRTWAAEEDAQLLELVAKCGQNWALIARTFPTHDRKRCRERYINHLDPALRRVPWSELEDRQLQQLHCEWGNRWAKISQNMAGRSPDDVKNRWIKAHSSKEEVASIKQPSQRWTISENDALRAIVEANGAKDWFFVASQIPGRTDLQCRQHWFHVLAPGITKGSATWSPEDDAVLLSKIDELGFQWEQIAKSLPGRLGKQCRERYLNHVRPSINTSPWTAEEDATLVTAYHDHPRQWVVLAEKLPGRAENAVKNHWHALQRTQQP